MSAGIANILIEQGATFERKLVFKDENQALIDLTGCTFAGQVRKTTDDNSILASFTFAILDQITNKGEVLMTLTRAQTSAIPVSAQKFAQRKLEKYTFDVERSIGAKTDRVIEGLAEISPEATR